MSAGVLLVICALLLFIYIFAPIFKIELNYSLNKPNKSVSQIVPIDKNFSIVIPKIGANSRIISNVDPYNSFVYQQSLTKGVAQARGTAFPDEEGNMFLFSHSSVNIIEATRYNSIFYLLSKLKKGDGIFVYYRNIRYSYKVVETKIVDAKEISYLDPKKGTKMLTLMTCWPAGTSYKRLLVVAK